MAFHATTFHATSISTTSISTASMALRAGKAPVNSRQPTKNFASLGASSCDDGGSARYAGRRRDA
eukprot:1090449-Prorocentrum_minimum.AAC.1